MKALETRTVVVWQDKFYFLPKRGDLCTCLVGNANTACPRKSVLNVCGKHYAGIAGYCRQCFNRHCPGMGYPTPEEVRAAIEGASK